MEGTEDYARFLQKNPDKIPCNPSTFLNQERWEDKRLDRDIFHPAEIDWKNRPQVEEESDDGLPF